MLGKNFSRQNSEIIFLIFPRNKALAFYENCLHRKIGFDFSYKLSPVETICMKCQRLFSGEKKKKKMYLSAEFGQKVSHDNSQF